MTTKSRVECNLNQLPSFNLLLFIFQCIKSRTICLRVKRRTSNKLGECYKLFDTREYFTFYAHPYFTQKLLDSIKFAATKFASNSCYNGLQNFIHQFLLISITILLLAKELAENSHVQDAFVIAVEQQAKERLERLSALRRIKPVDMTKLSQQVSNTKTTDVHSITYTHCLH